MPNREEQPGLEPVFPDQRHGAASTQSDHYPPQPFYSSRPKNIDQSTSRFEDCLPETVKSDSSLEPVYPGYHPRAPFRQPDHSVPQSLCTTTSEKPEASTTRPNESLSFTLSKHDSRAVESENVNETKSRRRRRKRCIWGGAGAVLCIIIVAILAGVLGARATRKRSHSDSMGTNSPTTSNSTSSSSTATLTQIRQGSDLAVTGWRTENGIQIFLYYQDVNGTLRSSKYDSGRGSFTTNNSYWEVSEALISVAGNTSVAAGMIIWSDTIAVSDSCLFLATQILY